MKRTVVTLLILSLVVFGTITFTAKAQFTGTQLAIILNGSGSISPADWTIMITGLAAAVGNPAIMPQDGSVELTVIQFGSVASVAVPPTVITAGTVAGVVATISAMIQPTGSTAMADAVNLAWVTVGGSANHDPANKQIFNLATDGMPNVRNYAATSDLDGNTIIDAYDDVIQERNNAITNIGLDEFDVEGIGISITNRDWFRDYVCYPQPGTVAPPFTPPGWIRVVTNADEFAATIDEKIIAVVPPPPVGGLWVPIDKLGLLAPYLCLVSAIAAAVAVSGILVKRKRK